jgi:O-antigen/teichoic acid export membrane protein
LSLSFNNPVGKMRQRLKGLDWRFIRGSAIISAGSAGARLLAMVYWLILARAFTPDQYGFVQYAITLATLVAILAQPVGQHVFTRYIGKHREQAEQLPALLSNLLVVLLGVFGASLLLALPVLAALGELSAGVVVVACGITMFYGYWGLANGVLASGRLTLVYLGSNLIQLAVSYGLITLLGVRSPQLALLIYGCSYLPAILLMQLARPLPLSFRPALVTRPVVGEILRFSWPVWVSHIAFTLGTSLPVLLLNQFAGKAAVGIYSLATTLAAIFGVVALGLSTQLMPTIAGAPRHMHITLLKRTMAVLLGVSVVMLALYVPVVRFVVPAVFGAEYLSSPSTYGLLAAVAIATGANSLLTAALVGGGRVRGEAVARVLNLTLTGALGLILVPRFGVEGAAAALLAGVLASIVVNTAVIMRRPPSDEATGPERPGQQG